MPYVAFHDEFPLTAARETRKITVLPGADVQLPAGEYFFHEMFCDEPRCDCRRVFFYVVAPPRKEPVAVVAYGWEPASFYSTWLEDKDPEIVADLKGPCLNRLSPQSSLAPASIGQSASTFARGAVNSPSRSKKAGELRKLFRSMRPGGSCASASGIRAQAFGRGGVPVGPIITRESSASAFDSDSARGLLAGGDWR